ncbi:PDZ domain-containing protein [Fundidesulfovibrio terrae]|uniref:PDZ domain-containing protein n=1 Tax=Fundidesulfovibrio terrae TaxID=2922866 RepID=UPI001FAEA7E8|nr:PDZ domain-containing protein [Fundidesulfovibrio terrae]
MNKLSWLFLLPCLLFTACNPYQYHYKPVENGTAGVDYDLCDTAKIEQIGKTQDLQAEMFKKGYMLIGYSAFNIDQAPMFYLENQAKQVKACLALVQKQYTHTENGYIPITDYHQGQQFTLNTTGSATGNSTYYNKNNTQIGSRNSTYGYNSTTTVQTPDYTTTTLMPYQQRMHDFIASFWARMRPSRIGILPSKIPDETKLKLNIEKGVLVRAVRDGSAAETAGFIAGDIIVGYNDGPFVSDDDLASYLKNNMDQTLSFTVRRLDKELKKSLTPAPAGQ